MYPSLANKYYPKLQSLWLQCECALLTCVFHMILYLSIIHYRESERASAHATCSTPVSLIVHTNIMICMHNVHTFVSGARYLLQYLTMSTPLHLSQL